MTAPEKVTSKLVSLAGPQPSRVRVPSYAEEHETGSISPKSKTDDIHFPFILSPAVHSVMCDGWLITLIENI